MIVINGINPHNYIQINYFVSLNVLNNFKYNKKTISPMSTPLLHFFIFLNICWIEKPTKRVTILLSDTIL